MTWTEFEREQPALAAEGRRQIYQWDIAVPAQGATPGPPRAPTRLPFPLHCRPPAGRRDRPSIGLGFLATVRADGSPRVHPVCPVISAAGLHVSVVAGPKQADLRRDGRYALHSETCP